jgi:hypothetical protein
MGIWSMKMERKLIKLVSAKRSVKHVAHQLGKPQPAVMEAAKRLGMNLSAKKMGPRR